MSLSQVFGPIVDDIPYALIGTSQRSIGTLIPDCAMEEIHRDEMQITQHPIEAGAPTTDHAFVFMSTVELRWGWSDSKAQAVGWVRNVYNMLLALQLSRERFNVSTGKRLYQNMLCRSLQIRTDAASEFALMGLAICQLIWITNSSTSGAGGSQAIGAPTNQVIADGTVITPEGMQFSNGIQGVPGSFADVSVAGAPAGFGMAPAGQVTFPMSGAAQGTQPLINAAPTTNGFSTTMTNIGGVF